MQAIRDNLVYSSGYLQGRTASLPTSLGDLYGTTMSQLTSFVTLPLPLISFLAIPLYGNSSTTVSLAFFYLTWSSLVWSKGPLTIELYGTLTVRLLCYLIPSLLAVVFDSALPNLSRKIKADGKDHLPHRLGREKVLRIVAVATGNVVLGVLVQAALELITTRVFLLRSLLKVSKIVPMPWTILKDILKGFMVRGLVHYVVHRYLLHEWQSVLKDWHVQWQHGISMTLGIGAAYDHPATYLLAVFLPTFLPAVLFRWHVLTWHLFLALVSLEDFFVFSGYTSLPSTIIIGGMARRNEAHFASVRENRGIGNYGRLGVLDLMVGTTCPDEDDVIDDVHDEVEKHNVQEHISDAVGSSMTKVQNKQKSRRRK